jgi:hypothetical protein
LESCKIGGAVTVSLLQFFQFLFCCHHMIWVPECCFQNCNQCSDICQIDTLIGDI